MKFITASSRCINVIAANIPGPTRDDLIRNEVQAFRARLKPARQKVANYAFIFDIGLYKRVVKQFEALEDDVCNWFDRLQAGREPIRPENLIDSLCRSQRGLLEAFRDYEFIELPRKHIGSRRRLKVIIYLFCISFALASVSLALKILQVSISIPLKGNVHTYQLDKVPALVALGFAVIMLGWAIAVHLTGTNRLRRQ